jgi:hypothetical protein
VEEIERSSCVFRVGLVVGNGGARGMSSDPRPENVWPLALNPNTPDRPVDVLGRGSRAWPLDLPLGKGDVGVSLAILRKRRDRTCGLLRTEA